MCKNAIKWSVAISIGLMLLAIPVVTWACSIEVDKPSILDVKDDEPTEEAAFPDEPVALEFIGLSRGSRSTLFSSECEGFASFSIKINGYEEGYGVIFDREGTYPQGMTIENRPVEFTSETAPYSIIWGDSSSSDEPIDFTMTAQWVDEYGRKGPTSDPLHVVDDGAGQTTGCASLKGSGSTPVVLALCMLGLVALRRSAGTVATQYR